LIEYACPLTDTCEIRTEADPELARGTDDVTVFPTVTEPNATLLGAFSKPVLASAVPVLKVVAPQPDKRISNMPNAAGIKEFLKRTGVMSRGCTLFEMSGEE
jgi:hypothetical protein